MILAVPKAERCREDNFSSKSKKGKGTTISVISKKQAEDSVVGKLANLLEKFDKIASIETSNKIKKPAASCYVKLVNKIG